MSFQSNSCFASRPKTAVFWRLEDKVRFGGVTQKSALKPTGVMKLTVSLGRILFIYSIYIMYIYIYIHYIESYMCGMLVFKKQITEVSPMLTPRLPSVNSPICSFYFNGSLQGPYVALVRRKNDTLGPYHLPSHSLSVSCDKPRCFTQFKVRIIKGSSLLADKMLRWPIRSRWIIRDT